MTTNLKPQMMSHQELTAEINQLVAQRIDTIGHGKRARLDERIDALTGLRTRAPYRMLTSCATDITIDKAGVATAALDHTGITEIKLEMQDMITIDVLLALDTTPDPVLADMVLVYLRYLAGR